jgi:hypothetical protein
LGETVKINVCFTHSLAPKHGFELSALDANNNHIGTFRSIDNKTQIIDVNKFFVAQASSGTHDAGNFSWDMEWIPPSSQPKDPVTFYATGNEANRDSKKEGDFIYATTWDMSLLADGGGGGGGGGGNGGGGETPTPTTTGTSTPLPTPTSTSTSTPLPTPTGTSTPIPTPTDTSTPLPTPTSTATGTPLSTPTPVPTPVDCETVSIVVTPGNLELEEGDQAEVTVNLITAEGCPLKVGEIVKAKVKKGKARVSLSPNKATTKKGITSAEANFIITAKNKKGKAKIKFSYGNLKVILPIKVVKKVTFSASQVSKQGKSNATNCGGKNR